MQEKEPLTLYLAGWQKRMLADFMPGTSYQGIRYKDVSAIRFKPGVMKCPTSYKIPVEGLRPGEWVFYLTDEQMAQAAKYLGGRIKASSFNISPALLKSGEIALER